MKMILLLKSMSNIKKLDQLILYTGPDVLSHIRPYWPVHISSRAGQEYVLQYPPTASHCEKRCYLKGLISKGYGPQKQYQTKGPLLFCARK
jgi:hypothetical protein